jgi:multidrug resistance efflux pump
MPDARPNKVRRLAVGLAGLAVLAFAVRGLLKKDAVDAYVVRPFDLRYTILANATVDYPEPVVLSFLQAGIVAAVEAKDGEAVTKGRPLVRLDDFEARRNLAISADGLKSAEFRLRNARDQGLPSLRQKLDEYELNLEQAELNRKRYAQLLAAGGVAQAAAEKAERDYQQALSQRNQQKLELDNFSRSGLLADLENQVSIARNRLDLAQRTLANTRLDAPFDGTVLKVHVQTGEKADAAGRAVTIIERAAWQLKLNVDQRELPFLRVGLPALITLDAYPGERLKGEISFICPDVDRTKNTCELRVALAGDWPFVKYGMAGRVEIEAATFERALGVPARFVKQAPGGPFVWVWGGRRASLVKTAARPVGERWSIVEGLAEGTVLLDAEVTARPARLKPGREVKPGGAI